jgi:hypothetical protein
MRLKALLTLLFLGILFLIPSKTVFASVSSCKYYVLDPWDPAEVGVSTNSNLPISIAYGRASASNNITNINITQDRGNTIGSTNNGYDGFYTSKTYDANGVYVTAASSLNSYITGVAEASVILNSNFSATTTFQVEMSDDGGSNYTSCTRRDDAGSVYHTYLLSSASISPTPTPSPTPYPISPDNYAVSLDGQSSYGVLSSFPLVGYNNSGDWSVEFRWYDPYATGLPATDVTFFEWNSTTPIKVTMTASGYLSLYTEGVWYTSPQPFNWSQGWHSIYVARQGGSGVHTGYFGVDGTVQTVTSPVSFVGIGDFTFGFGSNGYTPGLFDDLYISSRAQHTSNYTPSAIYTINNDTEALFLFNEGSGTTADDITNNNFQMILHDMAWTDKFDWSIDVDGQASYGSIPSFNLVGYNNSGDWSVEFKWYDPFQNGLPSQDFNFFEWNNQSVLFKMTSTGHLAMFTEGVWYTSPDPFNFSQGWHYIYVARKGGVGVHSGYFGVDGNVQTITSPVSLTGTGDFRFGTGPEGFTSGLLDDLHISSRAQHIASYTPTEDYVVNSDTEALFRFNEGYGNIAGDSTTNNFRMTLYNIGWSNTSQIVNQPPTADSGGPYDVNEGETVLVSATGQDPENGSLAYAWDMDNNGSFETLSQTVIFSAAELDGPDTRTIAVRVTDNGNLTGTDSTVVIIHNVAPIIGVITAPTAPQQINTSVNASASFTDEGTLDTHTAVWNWGDNDTSSGVVAELNGSGSVAGSHAYTSAGVYTVSLTVTDDDLGTGTNQFMYVVVYNPGGGFLTGSGRFDAPVGSIPANPSEAGMTNFGTNAKYINNTLTGSTRLNFRDGQYVFGFDSTSYDWLVITDGNLAKLHGSGTVNGIGNYTFELTALDNAPDTIRMQIWDSTNTIVYDNTTTSLTNGNVELHN